MFKLLKLYIVCLFVLLVGSVACADNVTIYPTVNVTWNKPWQQPEWNSYMYWEEITVKTTVYNNLGTYSKTDEVICGAEQTTIVVPATIHEYSMYIVETVVEEQYFYQDLIKKTKFFRFWMNLCHLVV